MTRENKFYHHVFPIFWFLVALIWHPRVYGREHIPENGAFIVYAKHSSYSDPVLMIYALGRQHKLHIIAKESIFKVPVLGAVLRASGTIPLDREKSDMQAVKRSMQYLKNGEKLGIFPEGTRVHEGDSIAAKSGFIRMAERMGTPLVPMYIRHKTLFFRRPDVFIGEKYHVNPERKRLSPSEYNELAENMMCKTLELRP